MTRELDATHQPHRRSFENRQRAVKANVNASALGFIANVIGIVERIGTPDWRERIRCEDLDAAAFAAGYEQALRGRHIDDALRLMQTFQARATPPGS